MPSPHKCPEWIERFLQSLLFLHGTMEMRIILMVVLISFSVFFGLVFWVWFVFFFYLNKHLFLKLILSFLQNKPGNLLNPASTTDDTEYSFWCPFGGFKWSDAFLTFLKLQLKSHMFFFFLPVCFPFTFLCFTGCSNTTEVLRKQCKCTGIKFH